MQRQWPRPVVTVRVEHVVANDVANAIDFRHVGPYPPTYAYVTETSGAVWRYEVDTIDLARVIAGGGGSISLKGQLDPTRAGTSRIAGATMYPPRIISAVEPTWAPTAGGEWISDVGLHQITHRFESTPMPVMMTAGSLLFVELPADVSIETDRFHRFLEGATASINVVLCELAMVGQVSAPVSSVQMGTGVSDGVTAQVSESRIAGRREMYLDRSLLPATMHRPELLSACARTKPDIIDAALPLARVRRLLDVGESLPLFVLGAYSHLSREDAPEALVDSFVVIELLLARKWKAHVARATERKRADRLSNVDAFSTAVRAEVLLTAGDLSSALYELIEPARKDRNDAVHSGKVTLEKARSSCYAMQAMIEDFLGPDLKIATITEPNDDGA
jgi:hypothetical protein